MHPSTLLAEILEASRSIHRSGSMSPAALVGLAKHLEGRQIQHSVETGAGASTLIFSHMSRSHTVFSVNTDSSISALLRHRLLRQETTCFIEGPTQKTLPLHQFDFPLQAVLLDGPHAYPFPSLEYFYLYPHLEENGLLVIDDIQIPAVHNLFRFLRSDDMFRLLEIREQTAFFSRTAAPAFDPWADGWWLQGFNKRSLWRYSWQSRCRSAMPSAWRIALRRYADRFRLWRGGYRS
jgi:hypothetical protein